jgi:hypothetical protein
VSHLASVQYSRARAAAPRAARRALALEASQASASLPKRDGSAGFPARAGANLPIAEAFAYLEAGRAKGKVVVSMG